MNTNRRKVLGVVIICLIIAGLAHVDSGAFAKSRRPGVDETLPGDFVIERLQPV